MKKLSKKQIDLVSGSDYYACRCVYMGNGYFFEREPSDDCSNLCCAGNQAFAAYVALFVIDPPNLITTIDSGTCPGPEPGVEPLPSIFPL